MRNTGSSLTEQAAGQVGDLLLLISASAAAHPEASAHPAALAGHWIQLSVSHGTFTLIESLGSALLPLSRPGPTPQASQSLAPCVCRPGVEATRQGTGGHSLINPSHPHPHPLPRRPNRHQPPS